MIAYMQIATRWSKALKVDEMDKHPTYIDEIYYIKMCIIIIMMMIIIIIT